MTSTDPERIQAIPTTDAEPPAATSVVTGPSQVPTSQADGRGRRSWGRRAFIGLVLVATFTVGIGVGQLAPSITGGPAATPNPSSADLDLFEEAWDAIHTQYVGRADLDDRALIYGAINGLTDAVGDTGHTSFMTPEERAARANALSGSYVGIGVRVTETDDGQPQIVSIFPNSPAETSGVKVGDVIVKVDGKTTADRDMDDVLNEVRGEAGTDRRRHRSGRRHGPGAHLHDHPRRRRPRAGHLDDGPRDRHRPPLPRLVLDRIGRCGDQGPRGDQDRWRGPAHLRPARQPRRVRERGRQDRQPVPVRGRRLHRSRRERQRDAAEGDPRWRRPRHPDGRPRGPDPPPAHRRSCPAPCRMRVARRSSA